MTLVCVVEEPGFPLDQNFLGTLTATGLDLASLVVICADTAKPRVAGWGLQYGGPDWVKALSLVPADQGLAILSTAAIPQPFWLQILTRAATAHPGCGAVSPLWGDFFSKWDPKDLPIKNTLLWAQKDKIVLEAEICATHCCYLTPQAVRALVQAKKLPTLDLLGPWLRCQGFSVLLHGNLFLPTQAKTKQHLPQTPALVQWQHSIQDQICQGLRFRHSPGLDGRPVQLHLIHSWGGGLEKWCRDFCSADQERINLVLRSIGTWGAFGQILELWSDLSDTGLLGSWHLSCPVRSTDIHNAEYAVVMQEIIHKFKVQAILVSSLIGHALDALATGLPTVHVLHDYYPFCPTISTLPSGARQSCFACSTRDLATCQQSRAMHVFFEGIDDQQWLRLRQAYFTACAKHQVALIAPTAAVLTHQDALDPRYQRLSRQVIEHGNPPLGYESSRVQVPPRDPNKPRLLILGELRPEKGAQLLTQLLPLVRKNTEVFLLGCGESAASYTVLPGIVIIPRYERACLGSVLAEIDPDLALFLSVWPETYSFTLSEVWQAGIVPVATNLGAFQTRIEHGVTGFLCAPEATQLAAMVLELLQDQTKRKDVQAKIHKLQLPSMQDMLAKYHDLLPLRPGPAADIAPRLYLPLPHYVATHSISAGLPFLDYIRASCVYLRAKHQIFKHQSRFKQMVSGGLLGLFTLLKKGIK